MFLTSQLAANVLLLAPAAIALLILILPFKLTHGFIIRLGSFGLIGFSILASILFMNGESSFVIENEMIGKIILGADLLITAYLLFRCRFIKASEFWIPILILAQAGILLYAELTGSHPHVEHAIVIDKFSIIMILIIGVIGSLIALYAISYMKDYHHHAHDVKDRRKFFFFIMFLFLSAMFGIVMLNNISWIFLCWEITTLCSFEMIGYSQTQEARRNSYRALGLNTVGGLAFVLSILYQLKFAATPNLALDSIINSGAVALIPVALLSFAGLTKSAQMPFSSWLLGAMIAPTPVSALLHSSTMVKAGVFIVVKCAPVLNGTWVGTFVSLVGGVTFLITSLLAVTQSNAKRVLAYSTIANLGLIIACAGVGTPETIWAAILLIIFHAVSKAQLFLGVGTTEHLIGSRDIEDMDGLIVANPRLTLVMLIGIVGMFLAPFGMLIAKWACISAFIKTNPILAVLLAFGSAPTLFFWTKWMGKLVSVPGQKIEPTQKIRGDEAFALTILAIMTIGVCGMLTFINQTWVLPYLTSTFGAFDDTFLGNTLMFDLFMLILFVILPIGYVFFPKKATRVAPYLAGANLPEGGKFIGSAGASPDVTLKNYYMSGFLSEKVLTNMGVISTIIIIVAMLAAVKI